MLSKVILRPKIESWKYCSCCVQTSCTKIIHERQKVFQKLKHVLHSPQRHIWKIDSNKNTLLLFTIELCITLLQKS